MSTYGKKKKSVLSSFAFPQNDKPDRGSSRQPSTSSRLESVKTVLNRTRSRVKLDDETNEKNIKLDEQSLLQHNDTATMTRQLTNKSTKSKTEHSDEPLPPMPHTIILSEGTKQTISERTAKSTKRQALGKTRDVKPNSSIPCSNESASNLNEALSRPATASTKAWSIHAPTTLTDTDEIQSKLRNLMKQAATQEEDTKRKDEIYASLPSKMTPFHWGKKVFVKATHAVRDRLSSHSNATTPNLYSDSQSHVHLNRSSETSSVDGTDENDTRKRLHRRIAEGRNLAKPKIQNLVGDASVPRKPLPVYESMRSRSLRSGSEDDPFSDDYEAKALPFSQIGDNFDINFSVNPEDNMKRKDPIPINDQANNVSGTSQQYPLPSKPTQRFSSTISGLAQHPDITDFSSSPLGFSTPRVRLERHVSAGDQKPKIGTPSKTPSLIDFSFEGQSEDEKSAAPSSNSKSVTDGSQSVKRKSAHGDLRSPSFPLNKKSKLATSPSNEEVGLAVGISQIDTGNERAPLSSKDKNATLKPPGQHAVKGRGLTIFELGKGKVPETRNQDENKKARPRPIMGRKSSLPRPNSMLSGGRDSQPGMKRLTSIDADSIDIDELQTDDARYQVGKKLR